MTRSPVPKKLVLKTRVKMTKSPETKRIVFKTRLNNSRGGAATSIPGEGFDINRSRIGKECLAAFLIAQLSDDLMTVPGIGAAAVKALAQSVDGDGPIETTYQLLAKFLAFKGHGVSQQEQCDAMWHFLKRRGVDSCRSGIVHALAEKANLFMPGLFDRETSGMDLDSDGED